MKRFCALILCLPVLFMLAVAEIEVERVAKHPDLFYMEHIGEAVTASESTSFDIGYRVSSAEEQPEPGKEDGMEFYALQYDLYIGNRTGRELENITITAHLRELPQMVFLSRHWYNEPQDLSAGEGSDVPCKALYTWNPFVVLEDLPERETVSTTDFCDMLIEIEWDGGYEVIRLDPVSAPMPEEVLSALDAADVLTEETIDIMYSRLG